MIYRLGPYTLDPARHELRREGGRVHVEPQVFALLVLLLDNRDRVVSVDEIVEKVWDGRPVSDAAVSSRVKSARRALGDDGAAQRVIRTLHRRGFRLVAPVSIEGDCAPAATRVVTAAPADDAPAREASSRPSIAVLPLSAAGGSAAEVLIAEALPHELITELARMRWLFVTARGSSFRLRMPDVEAGEAGRILGVRYCLTGTIDSHGGRLAVSMQLVDTRDDGLVWAERFVGSADDVHRFRADILAGALAALDLHIPLHEASRARLAVSRDLDAWSCFHLGLQHMYRFNRGDNAAAEALFARAVAQDPDFARAHAGLSFVHFQAGFMRYGDDLARSVALARENAARALDLDPLEPFANFAMGRSYWLEGDLDSGLAWLERATTLSPNYAQGIYARAWTETLAGRTAEGRAHVDLAMRLSPIDPLHYAMLGTRALGHVVLGEHAAAADWGERAARAPGAHVMIALIAALAHGLAGDEAHARAWIDNVLARRPGLTRDDFFRAFPLRPEEPRNRAEAMLRTLGL